MTSFGNVFKIMFGEKFRNMNNILMINVLAIIVSIIWTAVQGQFTMGAPLSIAVNWSMLAFLISFVMMCTIQEREYNYDSYRMMPISDTKFYSANLLSSIVSYLYLVVVEVVIYLLTATFDWSGYMQMLNGMISSSDVIKMALALFALFASLIILVWTTVTLSHLVIRTISKFIPSTRRSIVIVFNIAEISLFIYVFGAMMRRITDTSANFSVSFITTVLAFLGIAIVESAISIYLLNNWVETISE